MRTTFLKSGKKQSPELCDLINAAFEQAKEFKREKCVDQSICRVEDYFKSCRGMLFIDCEGDKDEHQAVKDSGKGCNSLTINMDNVSNLLETWMALVSDALVRITKPHDVKPTSKPDNFSPVTQQEILDSVKDVVINRLLPFSEGSEQRMAQILNSLIFNVNGGHDFVREVRDSVLDLIDEHKQTIALETAEALDGEMTDQIQESNYSETLRHLFRNFGRDRAAILKAPQFVFGYRDEVTNKGIEEKLGKFLFTEVVNIKNYFAAPNTTCMDNGSYEFDISNATFADLADARKCDGFIESGIDQVMDFFKDCDRDWLSDSWDKTEPVAKWNNYEEIPVLKGRIKVPGEMLIKFGIQSKAGVENDLTSYELVFWKIHDFIIYGAVILNRRPVGLYRVGSWLRTGNHVYDGTGITEIALPYQDNIDKAYELMLKNQKLSALGIWGVNTKKIDMDKLKMEDLVEGGIAIPVKTSVADGGNDRPIFNIRIDSNINELLTTIAHNQQQMEEQAQISALSVGVTTRIGSSIRTTGLGSLIQSNANRQTLSKITEMETRFILPFVKDLSRIIIWTTDNPKITSGAIDVQVTSFTDIIRQGDESQNIDFFIQNVMVIINSINTLEQQGINTVGLKSLLAKYAESRGFNAEDVFGESQALQQIDSTTQEIVQPNVPTDGRSRPQITTDLQI